MDVPILRAVLVIIAFLDIGAMLAIGVIHWRAWRILPAGAGLLPLHVFLVAFAVSGLQGTLAWGQLLALSDNQAAANAGVIVRLGLYFLFSVLLAVALGVMANLQYRRLTVDKEPVELEVRAERSVARIVLDGDTGRSHLDDKEPPA